MSSDRKLRPARPPLSDAELERLTAYDFGKVKLTEEEKLRFRAINERRRAAIQRDALEYSRAEAPLVQELNAAGAQVSSVWDLVNTKTRYPQLLPILFAHLSRPYPQRVREGIARALAVREARSLWDGLVTAYLAETDTSTNGMKWALHLAIAAAADRTVLDALILLACDRRHGRSRALFVHALARINDPRAIATLVELASDPDLAGDVQRVLPRQTFS
jgi:HEAT repeat protein